MMILNLQETSTSLLLLIITAFNYTRQALPLEETDAVSGYSSTIVGDFSI
jgi:hypothetical protein